ncbi:MAG: outer membrane beta-barrel protein [Spirochaetes bacterium]|jgi:hypothetical protein|nr:outer membrane beta-barrel protein [Spirochaetota bacterium]
MRKKNLILITILVLIPVSLFAADKSKLEWGKMPGVTLYKVEIRNTLTGGIMNYSTPEDHIWVEIGFGFYEMRITAFNKSGTEVTSTDWIPLTVMKTYQPEISRLRILQNGSAVLEGDNYYNKTKISIFRSGSPMNSQITKGEYPKKIYFHAPFQRNTKYSLLVENPGDYNERKIVHVFDNSSTMLFNNEHEYTRYFSDLFALASINYQFLSNEYWESTYDAGINSATITAGYHIFSWFGITAQMDFTHYKTKKTAGGDLDVTNNYITLQPGIFFSYKHKDFVPYIFGSAGGAFSWLSAETPESDLEYNSTDLCFSAGVGGRIFVYRSLFTDLSIAYSSVKLKSQPMEAFSIRLGFGSYFK